MIVFTAVLVALGGLFYCLAVRGKDLPPPEPASPTEALEEKKAAIYEGLRDLQRELATVLEKIDRLTGGETAPKPAAAAPKPAPPPGVVCPKCGARFPKPMKFCGECGAAMSGGAV